MTGQEGKPAKVSLARITIDAPPAKVYQKLSQVGSWNNWHTSAWVLRSPGLEKLAPGEKFAYTAPFVLGNIQSEVEESHEGKSLEWSDKALFGLVSGGHRWHLQSTGKKVLGILGKDRTQVTLDQEITGLGQLLVSGKSMEKHGATWLVELKKAVEEH
ncbi:g6932 [Coccomyxa viridis]|uniref:G6932 protein n=1 Tax=Coccomyxa viridis TaxID=1274662 RepID=A0ABP1G1I2_9CHLO